MRRVVLSPLRTTVSGLAILLTICLAASASWASTIPTSTVLSQYTIVSVGSGTSIMMNSGPVAGKVLVGFGSTVTSAGGGNGQITDGVDSSPPVSGCGTGSNTCFSSLATRPVVTVVASTVGSTAFTDAATLSTTVADLAPTQTFSTISGTQTITGNGGLNVINVGSVSSPTLTISGGPDDTFVFNVSGSFDSNRVMTLVGVTAGQILWNFTGTGTVFSTSGGNVLYGTFLATGAGQRFQFSSLNLTGQLINTGGHIQFVSNSKMAFDPFVPPAEAPPPPVPEPSSLLLFGLGLIALAVVLRRSRFLSGKKVFGPEPMQVGRGEVVGSAG